MLKIKDMTAKTYLEVEDTDVLLIEDNEDTKQITVSDLREYIVNGSSADADKSTKILINQTLDKIINALAGAKWPLKPIKEFAVKTWIESASGDIQIAIRDVETNKWLTVDELNALLEPDENGQNTKEFNVKVLIADVYEIYAYYNILDYNTEYIDPESVNIWLSQNNAGFLNVHFEGLSQNEIAGITYDDIKIELKESDECIYNFTTSEDSFDNSVPYVEPEPEEPVEPDIPVEAAVYYGMDNVSFEEPTDNLLAQEPIFVNGVLTVGSQPEADTTFYAKV